MKNKTKLMLPIIAALLASAPSSARASVIADWTFTGSGTVSAGATFLDSTGDYTATLVGGPATLTSAGLVLSGNAYLSTNLPYSAFDSGPATMQSLVTLAEGGNYQAIFGSSNSTIYPYFGTDARSTPGILFYPFGLSNPISGSWTAQHNYSMDETDDGYACIFQDGTLGTFNNSGISSFTGDVLIGGRTSDADLDGTVLRVTISNTSARDGGDPGTAADGYAGSWIAGAGQVVPEPSTHAMLIGGIGALTMFRRRRV